MIAVVRAAERGIGAALVPVPIADQWFKQKTIVRLFKEDLVADVSYFLVCSKDRVGDEDVDLLRSWIQQNFADPALIFYISGMNFFLLRLSAAIPILHTSDPVGLDETRTLATLLGR